MTRWVLILAIVVVAGGCAEVVRGPRIVGPADERFYIRHAPYDSHEWIDSVATKYCNVAGWETSELVSDEQFYPFDLRYATYTCNIRMLEPTAS